MDGALDQLGLRFAGAELSASRGADISRDGLDLEVVTPKTITLKYAAEDARKVAVPVLTVNEALNELDLKVDEDDRVAPGRGATLDDGDRLVVTKVRTVNKRVTESIDFGTIEKTDAGMLEGRTATVRSGEPGSRSVLYRLVFENGDVVSSKVLKSKVVDKPTDTIVRVGTKEPEPVAPPEPTPTTPAAAPSGTSSPSASPAATGRSTPATATTAASSSTWRPGSPTAARATRTRTAVRPRSRSPRRCATRPVATAPGRPAPPSSVCRSNRIDTHRLGSPAW